MTDNRDLENKIFEMVGAVKMAKMTSSFIDSARYSFIKQLKESKSFKVLEKDWNIFCKKYLGHDRKTINRELDYLEQFGEPFLKAAERIGITKRDLNALGSGLANDVKANIKQGSITIGEQTFKVNELEDNMDEFKGCMNEYTSELKEARASLKAERRVNENNHKTIEKLHKDLSKYENRLELSPEERELEFIKKMEIQKLAFMGFVMSLDPEGMVDLRELTAEQMEEIEANDPARAKLLKVIPPPTVAMRATYLETLGVMKKTILATHSMAIDIYGDPAMCPENAYNPDDTSNWEN